MSYSITSSESTTFTVTHARHLASKVAADLKRMQRFYGDPSDSHINNLEQELIALLKGGYLDTITYGYKKSGNWITPCLRYKAEELSSDGIDDDPGRVLPGADVNGASFYTYLERSPSWFRLTESQRDSFNNDLAIQRSGAPTPGVTGYFSSDKSYSSGGRALNRSTLKSY